ncbi:hypothetical protein COU15_00775 [Candidatus Kaiserbacteria bacterium CG10_big_fil_rev_8_21_14_0_10_45_20]|uniref:Dephospho-CoA kinase n=1 Tax=Candidatus Kaiserbacteria bacterium CG10_big_fil_rev_8_21_14_0_10_45_20 TaxID=1974607 RepID=A0A2H0UIA5_9BACT|nr:MAG: hypothetical protein COU15_00775 [Candidatus Kaiserbacteria bacterium CG10_big_fil_rev_8_21_14_0_10_45_20]
MIIGITGTDGAGKGTVVSYLVEQKNFTHYSARALLLQEIERQGLPNDRTHMRLVANELRKQYGNDYVARHYLNQVAKDKPKNSIIESIRAVAEAELLKQNGVFLLAVDADQAIRYERVQRRRSSSDKVTFKQFQEHEQLEINDPDPHGMQKQKVIDMADAIVYNNGTIEELRAQVDSVLATMYI